MQPRNGVRPRGGRPGGGDLFSNESAVGFGTRFTVRQLGSAVVFYAWSPGVTTDPQAPDIEAVVVPGKGVAACQAGVDGTRQNQALVFRELQKGTSPDDILGVIAVRDILTTIAAGAYGANRSASDRLAIRPASESCHRAAGSSGTIVGAACLTRISRRPLTRSPLPLDLRLTAPACRSRPGGRLDHP